MAGDTHAHAHAHTHTAAPTVSRGTHVRTHTRSVVVCASATSPTHNDCGMLLGRYLVLPYPGYLRDIIANLCAFAPAARFCFIGGEGCMQDPGPDNLVEVCVEGGREGGRAGGGYNIYRRQWRGRG